MFTLASVPYFCAFSSVFVWLLSACCCGCPIGDVIYPGVLPACEIITPTVKIPTCKQTCMMSEIVFISRAGERGSRSLQSEGVLCLFTARHMFSTLISLHVIFLFTPSLHLHVLSALFFTLCTLLCFHCGLITGICCFYRNLKMCSVSFHPKYTISDVMTC